MGQCQTDLLPVIPLHNQHKLSREKKDTDHRRRANLPICNLRAPQKGEFGGPPPFIVQSPPCQIANYPLSLSYQSPYSPCIAIGQYKKTRRVREVTLMDTSLVLFQHFIPTFTSLGPLEENLTVNVRTTKIDLDRRTSV